MTAESYQPLERREYLSVSDFYRDYVGKRPVVFTAYNHEQWSQEEWTVKHLRERAGHVHIRVRPAMSNYHDFEGATERMTLSEYLDYIEQWYKNKTTPDVIPPYAQDTPLVRHAPAMREKFRHFPFRYFPNWYQKVWVDYPCFFIGYPGNVTPLHFDNCETHNLFFQIHGKKKFFIVPSKDSKYCYRVGWRRSQIDARHVDYEKYPLFKKATVYEVDIKPGEVLYMPPRTWHQTYAAEKNISFNLDWHTRRSAVGGVFAIAKGMPPSIALFYNLPHAVGLLTGMPLRRVIRAFQESVLM